MFNFTNTLFTMTEQINSEFDLRTCFTNMQNDEGLVSLSKTQWEEILVASENV